MIASHPSRAQLFCIGVAADEKGGDRCVERCAQMRNRFHAGFTLGQVIVGNDEIGGAVMFGEAGECRVSSSGGHDSATPPAKQSARTTQHHRIVVYDDNQLVLQCIEPWL